MSRRVCAVRMFVAAMLLGSFCRAEIPVPDDAPQPKPPAESVKCFQVPEGFRLELVASEPLIRQPSGVCWDAQGRLYVSELHGYNLEGHYDILELNKTGELDRVVRRIQAGPEAREAAEAETYGSIKRLADTDGDGVMDQMVLFADRLPPCHGLCPARDGIIATCATEILFLADRDGDGIAEVRDVLFQGFHMSGLERAINSPRWTREGWIEVCSASSGGTIIGPGLAEPVYLPHSDFRIKPDGSAIESVLGSSRTFGASQTERGERIVVTTTAPGMAVAPIPWNDLSRNLDYAPGGLEHWLIHGRTYPISKPHPWRTRRAEDPGFSKFYTESYGVVESAPNGYFTSACSPFVYRDHVIPELHGQLLACEPAQNMIFRGILSRDGTVLQLSRPPKERKSEFLASTDSWFNPISITHGPDGSIYIVDFYREIIEDYSAVPRYLQQQYGLNNGKDHGRVWRLTHRDAQPQPILDLARLTKEELVSQLQSDLVWRRETAMRLLVERQQTDVAPLIANLVTEPNSAASVMDALYTLAELNALQPETLLSALSFAEADVRIHALRLAEPWLDRHAEIFARVLELARDDDPSVVLQVALSLGESTNPKSIAALAGIARRSGDQHWMDVAVLSSLSGRAGQMLQILLTNKEEPIGHAQSLLTPLAAVVASGKDPEEFSNLFVFLPQVKDVALQNLCWEGLVAGVTGPTHVELSTKAIAALKGSAQQDNPAISRPARTLVQRLSLETPEERQIRITQTLETVSDIHAEIETRLAAVSEIAEDNDPQVTAGLLQAVIASTPQIREAILNAIFSRQDRLSDVMNALDRQSLPASILTAIQRAALLNHDNTEIRERAEKFFANREANVQQKLAEYTAALQGQRNLTRGAALYAKHCATCHQAQGIGFAVGPDLNAEGKRSEETVLRDIIDPSGAIAANYGTYSVIMKDGRVFSGLLAAESASSVTLKQPEGKTQTLLRKEIEELKASPVSLMPDNLLESLKPQDVADILAWLRSPPSSKENDETAVKSK